MNLRLLPISILTFSGALLGSCAPTDYVPDTGWIDDDTNAEFYENWIGRQLVAAEEPPLATPADLQFSTSRLRLLVLPSFLPASIYRIDEDANGGMRLTYKSLDGAGGYEPGEIDQEWQRELTSNERDELKTAIDEAQLPKMTRVPQFEGEELLYVCADGTQLVVERLTLDGRTFVTRHECSLKKYSELEKLYQRIIGLRSLP